MHKNQGITMREYYLPPEFFGEIKEFAEKEGLKEVLEIVSKHDNGAIKLEQWESALLLKVAKLWKLQAELKYPFWDADHPKYNSDHEEQFFDAQDEHWGKIAMTFPTKETLERHTCD